VVHFIGQLQSNKVRALADVVDVWQTVDRASLADEIAKRAPSAHAFVQVNTTDEPDKGGCAPDATASLVEHCRERGLIVHGLMTVGPTSGDRAGTRDAFSTLRRLADELGLESCSMGMSGDFEIAIELGATHVRIGSALFGQRPQRRPRIG
jgi:pyridoxal phosphate enzyme (YggS family)